MDNTCLLDERVQVLLGNPSTVWTAVAFQVAIRCLWPWSMFRAVDVHLDSIPPLLPVSVFAVMLGVGFCFKLFLRLLRHRFTFK